MSSDQETEQADRPRTARASVPALEALLYQEQPCLDHGFVRVVDYMGDDAAIVQAARVSYGGGTKSTRTDRGLIRYLLRQRHTSPFEMCSIKLHLKMPIFVARQWVRHRTAKMNEVSARYSVLDNECYVPAAPDLAVQSPDNKQGRGRVLSSEDAAVVMHLLQEDAARCYAGYERLMKDYDLARELARINLTLGYYIQMYWKMDLHNLLHFMSLRSDAHAQYEIRVYSDVIGQIVSQWVPYTWEAYQDYWVQGASFARYEVDALRWLAQTTEAVEHRRTCVEEMLSAHGVPSREIKAFVARIFA